MSYLARLSALCMLALTAYHSYAAIVLFSLLARDKTTYWNLFRVVNCCDITHYEVVMSTASTAIQLAIVALAGRFLVPDVRPHFISLGFLDTG